MNEPDLRSPSPAAADEPGALADRLVATLVQLPRAAVEPMVRGVDGFYMAFQSALKTFGLVPEAGPAAEEQTGGVRFAVLPRREGRWPEVRLRLPDSAVYWYRVESIFRRGALWRSFAPRAEVEAHIRAAGAEALGDLEERTRRGMLELRRSGGGLTSYIRVTSLENGMVIVSLGQKVGRLRFAEAENALGSGNRDRTLPPRERSAQGG